MRKTRLMPIVPMAYGGNVTKKGLGLRRKMLTGGINPTDDTPEDAGLTVGSGVSAYNWADPAIPPAPTGRDPIDWKGKLGTAADAILPYASNIINTFRTPPQPATPSLVSPVTLSRIRLDASRNQVRNAARAQDLNADRSLDEQSAAAVRSSNLAKTLNQEGQISEQEAFLNARQRAESAGMNLNVDAMNTGAINKQRDEGVQRSLAIQREQSGNLANATDKAIGIRNERSKANLDLQKLQTLSQMWKDSGVYDRMMKRIKTEGIKDPTGVYGQMGWLGDAMGQVKAMGGTVSSPMTGKHPTHASILHRGRIGARKVFAGGGETGPGKGFTGTSMAASASSGFNDAQLADQINGILVSGNMPVGLDPQHRGLATSAYLWNKQNPMAGPEERIRSWYARPQDVNSPDDMLRGKLRNINLDPVGNYHATPNMNLQMRQGMQPSLTTQDVATTHAFGGYRTTLAKGYLSPFGNTRSIGMGPGIMHNKYNPKHISHVPHNMLALGGPKTDGSAGDDVTFTNYGDATPNVYRDGGPWQEEWAMGGMKFKNVNFFGQPMPGVPAPTMIGGNTMQQDINNPGTLYQNGLLVDMFGNRMAMGGLKPRLLDHSMWKQPYKENALTNNDPNLYATGGFDYSGETSARDMSMWNRKQWMDESVGNGEYKSGGWISKAVNPAHKGYCTPMTKSTCTPRRKAFAMTMKKHHGFHKKEDGGILQYQDGGKKGPRYIPNPPTYNMFPLKGSLHGVPSASDSADYLQHYNSMRSNSPEALYEFDYLNKVANKYASKDQWNALPEWERTRINPYLENTLNAYEDALTPGTMILDLPPDTKKPKKKSKGGTLKRVF